MNYVVDIALVLLVVASVVLAVKKGFFPTLFDLGAKLLAFIGAKILADSLAAPVYGRMLEGSIRTTLTSRLSGVSSVDVGKSVESALGSIPQSLDGVMGFIGVDKQALITKAEALDITGDNIIESLMSGIVSPVVTAVCRVIIFALAFLLLALILRLILGFISKIIKKLPVLKQIDKGLGGALGLVRGLLLVVAAVFIITLIASAVKSQPFIDAVASSKIVSVTQGIIESISGYAGAM